jgi:5'-nucleotidase
MHLLLTNDDGIDAPGLAALEAAVRGLEGSVSIVAPLSVHSGCAHRVTTDGPIRVAERGPGRFAVEGTPADCVRVALHGLTAAPDWVLAGVNAGGNLGADVYHSGTVAAVREAVLHGRAGIALSQSHRRGLPVDWERSARWAASLLRDLMARPWRPGTFWNVNFPHLEPGRPDPPVVFCPLEPAPLPLSFRLQDGQFHYDGDYHSRQRRPGTDVDVCFSGRIAVTLLALGHHH